MARVKVSVRIDARLERLAKEKANDFERSFGYIVELALREMFRGSLPPGWKPGDDNVE